MDILECRVSCILLPSIKTGTKSTTSTSFCISYKAPPPPPAHPNPELLSHAQRPPTVSRLATFMGLPPRASNYNVSVHMFLSVCWATDSLFLPQSMAWPPKSSLRCASDNVPPIWSTHDCPSNVTEICDSPAQNAQSRALTSGIRVPTLFLDSLPDISPTPHIHGKSLPFAGRPTLFPRCRALNTRFLLEISFPLIFTGGTSVCSYGSDVFDTFSIERFRPMTLSPVILLGLCSFSVLLFHALASS